MPKETGIIMSGSHPRDILDGTKTMSRRTWGLEKINRNPDDWNILGQSENGYFMFRNRKTASFLHLKCPYGQVGDLLWVRETWAIVGAFPQVPVAIHKADEGWNYSGKWKPSIFMPRWASRILLEITEVRAEHLRDITPADAIAEGGYSVEEFITIFLKLNHLPEGANPWDWPISFKEVKH